VVFVGLPEWEPHVATFDFQLTRWSLVYWAFAGEVAEIGVVFYDPGRLCDKKSQLFIYRSCQTRRDP
jgi:hypothetical protein